MAEQSEREQQPAKAKDRDERVSIPLDPEEALKGLLSVEPENRLQNEADGESQKP